MLFSVIMTTFTFDIISSLVIYSPGLNRFLKKKQEFLEAMQCLILSANRDLAPFRICLLLL